MSCFASLESAQLGFDKARSLDRREKRDESGGGGGPNSSLIEGLKKGNNVNIGTDKDCEESSSNFYIELCPVEVESFFLPNNLKDRKSFFPVKRHSMKTRSSRLFDKLSWNLEEDLAKLIETDEAEDIDLFGKVVEMKDVISWEFLVFVWLDCGFILVVRKLFPVSTAIIGRLDEETVSEEIDAIEETVSEDIVGEEIGVDEETIDEDKWIDTRDG
ncbi:hypothetical protein QYF36_021543 [Acer negundo]|nr:hypothetical protein QYF36_021543 [Acer negundo]